MHPKKKKSAAERFGAGRIYNAGTKKCLTCQYEYGTLQMHEKSECPVCKSLN